tara:strand:- start:97 stop:906 length:810 start_codon:yes stop_codon:yes gene_type:complete
MDVKQVLSLVLVAIIIYILYNLFFGESATIIPIGDASQGISLDDSKFPLSERSVNYSYSIWFRIDDFASGYGLVKPLLNRSSAKFNPDKTATLPLTAGPGEDALIYYPLIAIAPKRNDIHVIQSILSGSDADTVSITNSDGTGGVQMITFENVNQCIVENIPLQRWIHLVVSVNGRTLDIYINGKLTKTCILTGIPQVEGGGSCAITPYGGFNGQRGKLRYFPNSLNPQQVYNIYKEGVGESYLKQLFEKYRLQVRFMENQQEKYEFTI